jgi:RNA polymerase sigma-70 factor, ECF subfamily
MASGAAPWFVREEDAGVTDVDAEQKQRFEALFAEYGSDVVAYCGWRADSTSDAQDAVADVFLTAWRRLDAVPAGDAARVWLYAAARRVIANQRRATRRRSALHERLALEAVSAQSSQSSDRELTQVHDALRRLGERDREILLLAEWEGLSPAEIAAVLGCLTVTARGRLHRARRRFRALFEEGAAAHDNRRPRGETRERFHVPRAAVAVTRQTATHVREGGS